MKIGFDVLGDLNLSPGEEFNWENKATSLYCVIPGNISSDIKTIIKVLLHLSKFYQGVFYSTGALEYEGVELKHQRTAEIIKACKKIRNVAVLFQNVVIIDGIAILGCNGWFMDVTDKTETEEIASRLFQLEDLKYIVNSIEKLQKHLDVKKIVVVTGSVPDVELFFGEKPNTIETQLSLNIALLSDTQHKISHWAFGSHKKIVDITKDNINYLNNPYCKGNPYWAKRFEVEV